MAKTKRVGRYAYSSFIEVDVEEGQDDRDARGPSWADLLRRFTQETTLHGIRYTTTDSRFLCRKVLWGLICTAAISVFIYYLADRVSEYLKYRKNISVEENYVAQMDFPAITFCNQNRFRLTASARGGWYDTVKEMLKDEVKVAALRKCHENEFQCADGTCLDISRRCDTFPDCTAAEDEANCDPCQRYHLKVQATGFILPWLSGKFFYLQRNTYVVPGYVYLNRNHLIPLYLFHNTTRGHWLISDAVGDGQVFAESGSEGEHPHDITGNWSVATNESTEYVQFVFSCEVLQMTDTEAYREVAAQDVIRAVSLFSNTQTGGAGSRGKRNMEKMYKDGGHQRDDFIQGCLWNGVPCRPHDIKTSFTDLGLCYKFQIPNMYVEQSGPGYGLGLSLNIEQYEYTKDPQTGVGIKVALHDPWDIPVMQEKSFAISPGLYTMVSMEKTQVTNLEPPWGNCTSRALRYYEAYTVTTCKMDCENDLARTECGCRDIQMPQYGNDDVPVCTVEEYADCLHPLLDSYRKNGNFCDSCASPCLENVYVPSLSFASISTDDDVIKSRAQEESMAKLQEKLSDAREIFYRVTKDKYRQTMRMFQMVDSHLSDVYWFLSAVDEQLSAELSDLIDIANDLNHDCRWFTSMQYRSGDVIMHTLQPEVDTYMTFFHTKVYGGMMFFREMIYTIDSGYTDMEDDYISNEDRQILLQEKDAVVTLRDSTVSFPNYGNVYARDGNIRSANVWVWINSEDLWKVSTKAWVKFSTVRTSYRYVTSALEAAKNELLDTLRSKINDIKETPMRLLEPVITDILKRKYGRVECNWCGNGTQQTLLNILKQRLLVFVDTALGPTLESIQDDMVLLYEKFLTLDEDQLSDTDKEALKKQADSLVRVILELYGDMKGLLQEPLTVARQVVEELLRITTPSCESDFRKLIDSYKDGNARTVSRITDMKDYVRDYLGSFASLRDQYIASNISLEYLGEVSRFHVLDKYLGDRTGILQGLLRDRVATISEVHHHINKVNFWFISLVTEDYIAAHSHNWARFRITNPFIQSPRSAEGYSTTLNDDYAMVAGERARYFWGNLSTAVVTLLDNSRLHVNTMTSTLTEAHDYLKQYREGNRISESFFKKNFLQVDIFYKTLTDKKIVQQKAYEYPALISELGGLMGLLLGASVLTIAEVLDLLTYNSIVKCLDRRKKKPPKDSASQNRDYPQQVASNNGWLPQHGIRYQGQYPSNTKSRNWSHKHPHWKGPV